MMLDCEIVTTVSGAFAVRDRTSGEVMHPLVGPLVEAERLYIEPSRLASRLAVPPDDDAAAPLVLLDVGLGAGSNAIAAWRVSSARTGVGRPLVIVSFDRSLGALEVALGSEHRGAFGFDGEAEIAARILCVEHRHVSAHTEWRLVLAELPAALAKEPEASADVVFWDPFSPGVDAALWGYEAFSVLRRTCRAGATVHTYSGATAIRSALLLAGFAVGMGASRSTGKQSTIAAVNVGDLEQPLDTRWFQRLTRSTVAFPADAPPDALERVRESAQFGS
jgi:queuine tRNA-ribosyltransferase